MKLLWIDSQYTLQNETKKKICEKSNLLDIYDFSYIYAVL